ncbi:cell wall-binding repeat-containing protein [Rathayibacter sp. SD072]|uniref:cell wall-binding repeat-containing protein n=1 Tax=Rathayibacter sp. SD072 TaxID=2781731 RepID=UPI001A96853C|nr:cell wall-binding repeat-containing protein [Rathayibacter sp. SD072]MBO0983485.1 cell wall-binding repeat-containing protein [Rathayibacter sp. SD072]
MTPRRRRPSARLLALTLSTVGAVALAGLVASPASAADSPVRGSITSPASVPGSHTYTVQAWPVGADLATAEPVARTVTTIASGKTGEYALPALPDGSYIVRVLETPLQNGVPTVGDSFWEDTDWVGASTVVEVAGAAVTGIHFTPDPFFFTTSRVEGSDRYGTSAASTRDYAPGVPVLYIASGAGWADALSAAPAASAQDGALLLTDPSTLFASTSAEITRLAPKETVVVGSDATVSEAVFQQIDALVTGPITRIGGSDRYDTSRLIVADAFEDDSAEDVFLATGNDFPDALSVAPVAGRDKQAVLLVNGADTGIDAATRSALTRLGPDRAVILGRTASVSAGIEADVSALVGGELTRIGGASRYETSRLINEAFPAEGLTYTTYLASGEGAADALSGAAVAASQGAPLSLARPDCVPVETTDSLKRQHLDTAVVLGSDKTLSLNAVRFRAC